LLCARFPNQPNLNLVFVLGEGDEARSLTRPMRVDCPKSFGDNVSQVNSASLTVVEDEDEALWNTLFPAAPDGSRWFALQVAVSNANGAWDSRHGQNYRLVLAPER
jgi:hypothetical protein